MGKHSLPCNLVEHFSSFEIFIFSAVEQAVMWVIFETS
jgi:hypothetical protein